MRTYLSTSSAEGGGPRAVFVREGAHECRLNPRHDLRNHSPDGFQWGYEGSGPAQLALAVLADCLGDELALRHYQKFKREFVATTAASSEFYVREDEIRLWLAGLEKGATA